MLDACRCTHQKLVSRCVVAEDMMHDALLTARNMKVAACTHLLGYIHSWHLAWHHSALVQTHVVVNEVQTRLAVKEPTAVTPVGKAYQITGQHVTETSR